MKVYLVLIVYLFGSCVFILAMDPTTPIPGQQDSGSSSATNTPIQDLLIFPRSSLPQGYSLSPQEQYLAPTSAELERAGAPDGQCGMSTVVNEVSLARELLEYDYHEKGVRRPVFIQNLEKYVKQYPQGPVWSSAQARLGDMHRERAKEVILLEQFKRTEWAKRCYLSAYADEAALPETKSWAAVQLGYICLYGCKYVEAQKYFKIGEQHIKPLFLPNLYNGLGVAYYCLGKYKEAYKYWAAVIQSDNQREKGRAYHNLAILSAHQGHYAKAIQYLSVSRSLGHPYANEEFEQLVSSWKSSSLNSPVSL